jgi:hypothetical protein
VCAFRLAGLHFILALDPGIMNVVPFRASRRSRRLAPPLRPPGALGNFGPVSDQARTFDDVEDRLRMQQNLGAFVAVLVIVVAGGWLIDRLTTYSRNLACLTAGHRNCVPLDIEPSAPWERSVDVGSPEPRRQGK